MDNHHFRDDRVPYVQNIERLMVETENAKEFRQFFIIFVCTTVLASTTRLEGHHALWHAPPKAITWDVNWG